MVNEQSGRSGTARLITACMVEMMGWQVGFDVDVKGCLWGFPSLVGLWLQSEDLTVSSTPTLFFIRYPLSSKPRGIK